MDNNTMLYQMIIDLEKRLTIVIQEHQETMKLLQDRVYKHGILINQLNATTGNRIQGINRK